MLIVCSGCNARIQPKVVAETAEDEEFLGADGRIVYRLLTCTECETVMLAARYPWDDDEDRVWTRCYPTTRSASTLLPKRVQVSLDEAINCYEMGRYLATVLMARRVIEATVETLAPRSNNLASGIDAIRESGKIDDSLKSWAHELRVRGNLAAHDTDATPTKEEARDLLEFAEAIANYVFELPERFARFKRRHSESSTGPTQ